jgi:hypothetical protein
MLTLFSSLIGFLSAGIPQLLKYFQDRQDKKHELDILRLQIQRDKDGHGYRMAEIEAEGDIKFMDTAQKAAAFTPLPMCGIRLIDGISAVANIAIFLLTGSVRPLVTFAFVGLYAWVKIETYQIVKSVAGIWSENDMALFAAILSFWFCDRMIRKYFTKAQ